ncbi:unnamed protein product [Caenorhabditis angaria]|uniref:Uncharacterized protein n=1 Tax=Caenorhabditis angaria TaxID=860376 RepID=A0A9P1I3F0_9PELO|nr:unnamed protein product [Caenorhabditis angaria]
MSQKRKIERISEEVAERITTAQVVVSLASAIRQLVDNSIDAGSTIIDIRAKNNGFDSLEVQDNGCGIEVKNFDALCKPHSTSKLTDFSDFDKLSTLGFRGEALNALCALSTVTIFTKSSDASIGTRLKYDHRGNIIEQKSAARETGTTILIENLFETLPVRRKQLEKSAKRDFFKLLATVQSFCLMRPNIKFLCTNMMGNKKQNIICTPGGNSTIRDVVSNLFGISGEKSQLIEIKTETPNEEILEIYGIQRKEIDIFDFIKITGFISNCEHGCGRSTSDRQFVYINNRPVDYSRVCATVNEVYRSFNKSQYPIFILFIEVPGDKIDVNVTPDKKTVMFEKEKHLLALLRSSIIATFQPILGSHSTIRSSVEDRRNCSFYSSQSSANSTLNESNLDLDSTSILTDPNGSLPNISDLINQQPKSKKSKTMADFVFRKETPEVDRSYEIEILSKEKETSFANVPKELSRTNQSTYKIEFLSKEKENSGIRKIEPKILENMSRAFETCANPRKETIIESNEEEDDEIIMIAKEEPAFVRRKPKGTLKFNMNNLRDRLKTLKIDDKNQDSQKEFEFSAEIRPEENNQAEEQLSRSLRKEDFEKMRIIGQFNKGFIITELRNNLFIIDQHASDEKYNFEKLQKSAKLTKQPLFAPTPLNFGAVQEMIIRENLHIFRSNGFEFNFKEIDGCLKTYMTARPEILSHHLTNSDLEEIVAMVSEYPNQMYRPAKIRKIFASRACRKSIMIGKALDDREMRKVVRNLAKLDQPWNCPHGRPTIRHLKKLNIE